MTAAARSVAAPAGALRLHGYPSTAAMIPHLVLHELGEAFEWVFVDRANDAHKSPDFLRLNPNGLLPVLVDARGGTDLVLYETAAIAWHLVDTCPGADLAGAPGSAARAEALKWIAWLSATLQPALIAWFYPERWVDAGNAEGAAQVRRHAQARIDGLLDQLDAQLASHGGPWVLGSSFSLVDPYAFTLCRWTRTFARPARGRPSIGPWLQRMLGRDAVRRVLADEGLGEPYV